MITIQYVLDQFYFLKRYILLSAIIFFSAAILGYVWAQTESPEVTMLLEQLFEDLASLNIAGPVTLFLLIFLNNTVKSFFMMILGVLFGIAPFFFLFSNGFIIGIVIYALLKEMTLLTILLGLLPHGIIEIPLLFLSAALGMWLGSRFMLYIRHNEGMMQPLRKAVDIFLYVCVPLFFFAAFVEVFITDTLLSMII